MTETAGTHGHHHAGFHGPRCWVVSAIAGALLGLLLSWAMPAKPATGGSETGGLGDTGNPAHAAIVVVETRADGSQHLRHHDGQTTRLDKPFDPTDRAAAGVVSRLASPGAADDGGTGTDSHGSHGHGEAPEIPLALCVPFALLLLSIAVMPFIHERFWHAHYPDFAFLLGSLMLTYYLAAFGGFGRHEMLHAGLEYYAFIALVGGLYVVSGGILVGIRGRGGPLSNTLLLALGAVAANIVGTTGASVLLIRPFLRMNKGRLRPMHVVFFIFIVSNCGGCLTPIGDPPLYLGFLKGVPFFWTLSNLWPMWLLANGLLLAMFAAYDLRVPRSGGAKDADSSAESQPLITGWPVVGILLALVACVFVDPFIRTRMPGSALASLPVGATLQIALAIAGYAAAKPAIRNANQFTFAPVKEVGFLFVGIFLTMVPALGYLRVHASSFGLETPTQFYYSTGVLSALLDNAPTYLSFLQVAFGVLHLPLDAAGIAQFIGNVYDIVHADTGAYAHFDGARLLQAISLGAVFFGAMTYIGNGPNFMVKSIVESAYRHGGGGLGVRMPSFFGYLLLSVCVLLPVLVVIWAVFVR